MTRSAMTRAAVALALLAAPATTWAATDAPPPPSTLDDAGVKAWVDRYIEHDGWTVLGTDQGAVAMSKAAALSTLADTTLQAQIRHEYFKPADFGPMQSRSNLQIWNVDCEGARMRVLAIRIYEGNNLQGRHEERENLSAPWTALEPGSAPARTAEQLCSAKDGVASRQSGTAG